MKHLTALLASVLIFAGASQSIAQTTSAIPQQTADAKAAGSQNEKAFFDHISGQWAGEGEALLPRVGELYVDCDLKVDDQNASILMSGECGALFMSNEIGVDLQKVDGGGFEGVYTGPATGPAELTGGPVADDKMTLDIVWGGEVHGDREATMVIERTGADSLRLLVNDTIEGEEQTTSSFDFVREGTQS